MSDGIQRALTGFAAGVMVAASVWSLLIPAIEQSAALGKWSFVPAAVGFWIGVLFLLLLDHVVGCQKNCHTCFCLKLLYCVPDALTRLRIKASCGLVKEQYFRRVNQRPRNISPAPLSAREFSVTMINKFIQFRCMSNSALPEMLVKGVLRSCDIARRRLDRVFSR